MSKVYINGNITEPENAKISVYDRGFLFGDGVYEVVRSYGKILFTLEQHIERLYRSAQSIGLDIPFTEQEFIDEIYRFYWTENDDNKYIRIQISRGNVKQEQINLSPSNYDQANIVMYLHDLKLPSDDDYKKGLSLQSSDYIRNTKKALDPNIKSGNYLNNILALKALDRSKFSDRFLLDKDSFVTEGTTFNIFLVKNGLIFTSPDESDILQGITRGIIFHCSDKANLTVLKEKFNLKQLLNADEVFITSSTKEIMPVTKVNLQNINNSEVGPVTNILQNKYKEFINDYCQIAKNKHKWKNNA